MQAAQHELEAAAMAANAAVIAAAAAATSIPLPPPPDAVTLAASTDPMAGAVAPLAPGENGSKAARRDYVLIDPAIRNRAIELVVNQNWKVTDAARVLGVKRSMLYKSVSRFKKDRKLGRVKKPAATPSNPPREQHANGNGGGAPLTAVQTARLRAWAEDDRTLSAKALAEKARAEFGYPVAVASVRRAVEGIQVKLLTDDEKARLREWAEDDRTLSHKALADRVKAEFGFSVSVATVNRALRGLHFSLERLPPLLPTSEQWNNNDAIEMRHEYAMAYMRLLPKRHKFVFVGQVPFAYSLLARLSTASAAASPSSSSAAAAAAGLPGALPFAPLSSDLLTDDASALSAAASAPLCSVRTQPVAVMTAVMEKGILMYKASLGEPENIPFETLVTRVSDALRRAKIEDAVIVLNAAYKGQSLAHPELMMRLGHSVLYLPPASPFLNPAESFFGDWKQLVQRGTPPATERDLVKLLETCGASVTADECAAYFRKMEAYIYPSVVKANIFLQ